MVYPDHTHLLFWTVIFVNCVEQDERCDATIRRHLIMLAIHVLMGLNARKPVFGGLISDFVIRFLESIIYKLATGEITIF